MHFPSSKTPTIYKLIILLCISAFFASCGVSKKASQKDNLSLLQEQILQFGKKYLGKPYRYASNGPNSFDCSGFTSFVFREFGFKLSAGSAEQDRQVPTIANRKELVPGDLVFFEGRRQNGQVGHVGIVTEAKKNGDFNFIHASTSFGVIISSSNEPYYASRYLRGGRVLKDSDNRTANLKRKPKNVEKQITGEVKEIEVNDIEKKDIQAKSIVNNPDIFYAGTKLETSPPLPPKKNNPNIPVRGKYFIRIRELIANINPEDEFIPGTSDIEPELA